MFVSVIVLASLLSEGMSLQRPGAPKGWHGQNLDPFKKKELVQDILSGKKSIQDVCAETGQEEGTWTNNIKAKAVQKLHALCDQLTKEGRRYVGGKKGSHLRRKSIGVGLKSFLPSLCQVFANF